MQKLQTLITALTLDRDLSRIVVLTYPHGATIQAWALNTKTPTLLSQHYMTRSANWERSAWAGIYGPMTTLHLVSAAKPNGDRRGSKSIHWWLKIARERDTIFHVTCNIKMPGPITAPSSGCDYTFWHFPAAIPTFTALEQWIGANTPCPK